MEIKLFNDINTIDFKSQDTNEGFHHTHSTLHRITMVDIFATRQKGRKQDS
jgi:hypothetical protein